MGLHALFIWEAMTMFHFFKRKHTYAKRASEAITHITNAICKNDDLIRYLYYPDFDPLSKPKLSIEEKRKMLGVQLIPSAMVTQSTPKCEIRTYFTQGEGDRQSYDLLFITDIIVPDELLYTSYGLRNWLIADEFLKCQGILGFIHMGKPDFKNFEQVPLLIPSLSCLRLTAKADLTRW